MKHIKKINIIVLICTILGLLSCEKDYPYGHPTCDTCDWDVMTCKVDGVSWQARKKCELLSNCDPVDCQYYSELKYLEIRGFLDSPKSGVSLVVFGKDSILGTNVISKSSHHYSCSGCNPLIDNLQLDSTFNNYLSVTKIDTISRILEGHFEMQLINSNEAKIKITEGYFKLTYRY